MQITYMGYDYELEREDIPDYLQTQLAAGVNNQEHRLFLDVGSWEYKQPAGDMLLFGHELTHIHMKNAFGRSYSGMLPQNEEQLCDLFGAILQHLVAQNGIEVLKKVRKYFLTE